MSNYAAKIAALLAKAESSTHEAEAQTFRDKAQELMLKWGIEDAELEAAGKQPEDEVVCHEVECRGQYHRGLYYVGSHTASGLGSIRPFITNIDSNNWTRLTLVGHKSDVDRAVTLINSLFIQSDSAMRQWWKEEKKTDGWRYDTNTAWTARRQFFISFGAGVYSVLTQQRKNLVTKGSSTDLVLVDRGAKVDDWVSEQWGEITPSRSSLRSGSVRAQQHGYRAGQRAAEGGTVSGQIG